MNKLWMLKEFVLSKKNLIILGVVITVSLSSLIIFFFYNNQKLEKAEEIVEIDNEKENEVEVENEEELVEKKEEVAIEINEPIKEEFVLIDIKGEVKNPGLYKINKNNRVQDAINLAGGITENADTSTINLSKKVFDEMVIIVYTKKIESVEIPNNSTTTTNNNNNESQKQEIINEIKECPNKEEIINDACVSDKDLNGIENKDNNSTEADVNISSSVSINTASKELLMTLPGIGESKAEKIIEYRNQIGSFEKIEDIKQVSGIGDSVFEKIKSYITL